jgi:hypothetical protein
MMRGGPLLVTLILAGMIGFGAAIIPGKARAAGGDQPPLTMEELEVRGRQEKPDRLFLPVPRGIRHAAPVRFDLFREDMTRPVLPLEINSRNQLEGGNRDYENALD